MFLLRQIFNLILLTGVLFSGGPRIISLAPSMTDFLIEFGLDSFIVGKTYLDPEYIKADVVLNSSMRISKEKILKLKPTHILSAGLVPDYELEFLKKYKNVKVFSIKYKSIFDIAKTYVLLGEEFGKREKTLYLLKNFLDSLFLYKGKKNKIRVLYVLDMQGGIWTCGKNTFISDLLNWVGFENIGDKYEGYKIISPEIILKENPEIVIFAFKNPERFFKGTFLEKLPAIKNKKYYSVPDPDYLSRPSPLILKGLKFLAFEIE